MATTSPTGGSAAVQGELWGARADDWEALVEAAGLAPLRAVEAVLGPFRTGGGGVRLENTFRSLLARA
jgi:hypothetical protein